MKYLDVAKTLHSVLPATCMCFSDTNMSSSLTAACITDKLCHADAPSSSSDPAAAPAPAGPSTAVSTSWEGVDESQPSTSLQLRLADGSRMVSCT